MKGRIYDYVGAHINYVGVYIYNNVNFSVGRPKGAYPPSA